MGPRVQRPQPSDYCPTVQAFARSLVDRSPVVRPAPEPGSLAPYVAYEKAVEEQAGGLERDS